MKKIVCLYGGPGTGKSTTAAGVFFEAKNRGLNVEMNREYIKDWVWEGRDILPGDQTYFFAKAARKERLLMMANVELIVTDSPLVLTHLYGTKYDKYERLSNTSKVMLEHHHAICKDMGYSVDHFVLGRQKPYNPLGRNESEEVALEIDTEIVHLLNDMDIKYHTIVANAEAPNLILASVEGRQTHE